MSAGTVYSKRYGGGFVDLPSKTTPIDQQFLNAVETALLQLIGAAPTVDGQVAQWDFANTRFGPALLLNKNIDPAAAIAKSKLDFTGANGIVNADIAASAAIAASKLNLAGVATVPTGGISAFAGSAAPSGWVLCDGTSYLRADGTHDALFAVIGTGYGSADGTHFNVPDLQGRVAVGLGTNASVNVLNANDGQTLANRRPHHRTTSSLGAPTHTLTLPDHSHHTRQETGGGGGAHYPNSFGASSGSFSNNDDAIDGVTSNPAISGGVSAPTGSIGTNNANDALDVPSFVVVNFIIKL